MNVFVHCCKSNDEENEIGHWRVVGVDGCAIATPASFLFDILRVIS